MGDHRVHRSTAAGDSVWTSVTEAYVRGASTRTSVRVELAVTVEAQRPMGTLLARR